MQNSLILAVYKYKIALKKLEETASEIKIQELNEPFLNAYDVTLSVLREDLFHPLTGGNKWRKLKYNLLEAKKQGYIQLLTFGGAYSNHLVATAVSGKAAGFKMNGIVRGEEIFPLNRSLQIAADHGMQLHYVSRELYRNYRDNSTHHQLQQQFGDCYILPEGGSNILAVKGCAEIIKDIKKDFDIICVAVGTGATLAGITYALHDNQRALGICVLKNGSQVKTDIKNWHAELKITNSNWELIEDYHFGGYAKSNAELKKFVEDFSIVHKIRIEPIYTGKLFFGIYDLIKKNFFRRGARILAVHTGGLQYLQ